MIGLASLISTGLVGPRNLVVFEGVCSELVAVGSGGVDFVASFDRFLLSPPPRLSLLSTTSTASDASSRSTSSTESLSEMLSTLEMDRARFLFFFFDFFDFFDFFRDDTYETEEEDTDRE